MASPAKLRSEQLASAKNPNRDTDSNSLVAPKKLPPAFKHGGYSSLDCLPGEDRDAFNRHVELVFGEFQPQGPIECSLTQQIALISWRMSHLEIFKSAEKAREEYKIVADSVAEGMSVEVGLQKYFLHLQKIVATMAKSQKDLRDAKQELNETLEQKFLPVAKKIAQSSGFDLEKGVEKFDIDVALACAGKSITEESMFQQIAVLERLNSAMQRLIKNLMIVKASKEVVGLQMKAVPSAQNSN